MGEGTRSEGCRRQSLLSRRSFLAGSAAALAMSGALAPLTARTSSAQTASHPNFVVVMTDDLDKRSMQELGGIRDVMGYNGATFENAYVTDSLCCPSRATFLRGQYTHNHGVTDNALPYGGEGRYRELGLDQSTIATWLHDAGYRTSYIGKYTNGYDDLYKPPGWDEWFVLQGDPTNNQVNDNGQSITIEGNSTDTFANEASDFIRRSSASPEPFFVMVGTKAAHGPPEVAERYQGSFATTLLPESPNFNEVDVSDKPAWVRGYPLLTPTKIEGMQGQYRERLRSMLSVEDLLRQTVATLQETGELDNTYILFTSDNGFHMGNHRFPLGKVTPYEEDTGVPLMVRGPGVPAGAVRRQLIVNTDFAPTLADLAGVSTPAFVDGSSFASLLTDSPPSSWRQAFLEEGWPTKSDAQGTSGGLPKIPINKGVHTQDHVFVEYETGEHELYDLISDPYQLESKPRAGNEQLYSTLQTRLDALRTCSGADCHSVEWATIIPLTDTTSPRVMSTVPKAGATGVDPTTNVKATFSEDMDSSTISGKVFKLFEKSSTTKVAAAVSYDASTDTATLVPSAPLRRGVTYRAVVTTGAKDVAGNPLDQNNSIDNLQRKAWSFTVSN